MEEDIHKILNLMKRIGEDLPIFSEYDILRSQKPLIIKEGLITTYPTSSVVNAISSIFHLTINNEYNKDIIGLLKKGEERKINGDISIVKLNEENDTIVITLKNNSLYQNINSHLLKYGWVNYRTEEDNDEIKYYYEKRFGDRFSVKDLKNLTPKIYHITSSTLKNKILKQGLIPKKSKTSGFENEARIYFRIDLPSKEQAFELNIMKLNFAPPVVFEVDLNKLDNNQSFFYDSRWLNSIYTFEPIPPSAIRIMEENELLNIKLF